jgi:hypothetical protein
MSGFQIPLDLKIDFLENVVLPSLGVHPPFCENEARYDWMRKRVGERYSEHLEDLILAFNWICEWGQAEQKLIQLKQENREERQLLLVQQPGQLHF